MAWLGPDLPREYLNVTQTAAITKGAFSLGGVTKNTEGALGDLVEVASPIAIAGATGGALINILKVIDRMCMDKWEFFQWCEVGVSMASIVLAVAALTLAFTGVGVPVAAFALALAGFMVRRGGALVCSNGGIKGISRAARTFFEQMWTAMKEEFQKKEDEVGEFFRTLEPGDIAQKAVTAAQSFFQLFYWLLKNIGKAIEELPAKFMKDVASKVAHALGRDNEIQVQNDREAQEAALREKKKRRICCAAETAREVDKEIAQDELVKEFVEKFETEIVEKEA